MTWKIVQKITFLEILKVNHRNFNLNLSFLCHFIFEICCTIFISYSENLLNPIVVPWLGLFFGIISCLWFQLYVLVAFYRPWFEARNNFELILIMGTHKAFVYGKIVTKNTPLKIFAFPTIYGDYCHILLLNYT